MSSLPPLDCSNSLLCRAHSQLVIPTHVEEYLLGVRKSLLCGLGTYMKEGGEVTEIITTEEWDELQKAVQSSYASGYAKGVGGSDLGVRFCLDGENVAWSLRVCTRCNPFNYSLPFK